MIDVKKRNLNLKTVHVTLGNQISSNPLGHYILRAPRKETNLTNYTKATKIKEGKN